MSQDCPVDYEATFYKGYLSLLLSVCYHLCSNLNELRHLVSEQNTRLYADFELHYILLLSIQNSDLQSF